MQVLVAEDQLSLAIGKRGQNVRLAAKLTQWKIDIRNAQEAEADSERQEALRLAESVFQPVKAMDEKAPSVAEEPAEASPADTLPAEC